MTSLLVKGGIRVDHTDAKLVSKSARGNYEAYAELVRKYSNLVYAIALSKTSDFYQAEDIAQEVFVKAWMKINELKEGEKFSHWLSIIARNMCMDWLRKKSRIKEETIPNEVTNELQSLDDSFNQFELKTTIWNALETLDEKYRLVTIMYYISGYSTREIAEFMSVPVGTIETRLKRAKAKLKEELFDIMKETFADKKVGKQFEEEVMWRIVPRIATIEIPVSNLKNSIAWYSKILGTKAVFEDDHSAMLHLQGSNQVGVPTLFLVQTDEVTPLAFNNTHTGVKHSVIDFYIQDLERFHRFLQDEKVTVTNINYFPDMPKLGGFGFEDPDGHLLSVCNVTHSGQE